MDHSTGKTTPLHEAAQAAGARFSPFAGWIMPLQFTGVVVEHRAVRSAVGVFDISHMGVLTLQGPAVKDALQGLVPSDLGRIGPGEAQYTVLLNEQGGILDDLIVYDRGLAAGGHEVVVVVNAARCAADTAWLEHHLAPRDCTISDRKGDGVLLALQGPRAVPLLERLRGWDLQGLPRFGHRQLDWGDEPVFLARTGYTGEDGVEALLSREGGQRLWQELLEHGAQPCGLAARDTLRLEAALHLYGRDMDTRHTPLEASLGWLVHLETPHPFIGREVLETQTRTGVPRRLVGLTLRGRAIARQGHSILDATGAIVGVVTSGAWSPSLGHAVALGYVPPAMAKPGTDLLVQVRGQQVAARVVRRPFYRRPATPLAG